MEKDKQPGENAGNNSGTNSASKVLIIVENADASVTIAAYVVDQALERPLKVFGHEPVSVVSHDKLPNRYNDIFKRAFSKVSPSDEDTKPAKH